MKWYPARPGRTEPWLTVTVDDPPVPVNDGPPQRVAQAGGTQVTEWVAPNRQALIGFWDNGMGWPRQEVAAFIDGLHKVRP